MGSRVPVVFVVTDEPHLDRLLQLWTVSNLGMEYHSATSYREFLEKIAENGLSDREICVASDYLLGDSEESGIDVLIEAPRNLANLKGRLLVSNFDLSEERIQDALRVLHVPFLRKGRVDFHYKFGEWVVSCLPIAQLMLA